MVAIAHPSTHDPVLVTAASRGRSHLRLVPPTQRTRRPSAAVLWRRRALATLALVAATVVVGGWGSRLLGAGGATGAEHAQQTPVVRLVTAPIGSDVHVVIAGDSLWSIARDLQPEGDVRPLVDRLSAGRHGRALQVGERIRLPIG